MNTTELIQYSLGNAFDILGQVTADLTQEQADSMPAGIANPIGALYWHTISCVDDIVNHWARGQATLGERAGWPERMLAAAPKGEPETLAEMRSVRIRLPEVHEYARAVAAEVQAWLGSLTPADLERKMDTPIGHLNVAQMLEIFVLWHINAHCGEISALKGCQGCRGYPF